MIRVGEVSEYAGFDSQVRQPGLRFLKMCNNPTSSEFKKHNYWIRATKELHTAYRHLCAYTTRELVKTGSIDHFKPKSKYPKLAYEWSNYRLARQAINLRKGNSEDVIDPFTVHDGWFTLDMPSCLIRPAQHTEREVRRAIHATINTLGLNRDESLVEERHRLLVHLADGNITLEYLDGHYPFLSSEVRRQQVQDSLKLIFSRS